MELELPAPLPPAPVEPPVLPELDPGVGVKPEDPPDEFAGFEEPDDGVDEVKFADCEAAPPPQPTTTAKATKKLNAMAR